MTKSSKIKIISGIITAIALALLVWFMVSGDNKIIIHQLIYADLSSEEYIELIRSFGLRGSITLSLLSMMQVVIPFLPEEPVQVLTGMGYGVWHGILICLVGIVLGNTLIYIACKIFGKSSMEKVHSKDDLDIDFEKIGSSKRVVLLILLLYILPAVPLGVICLFACSLNLKFPRYFIITTLGSIPSILAGVALGHMATSTSWIVSVVVFAIILVLIVIFAINKKKIFKKFNEYVRKKENKEMVVKRPNKILYFFFKIGFILFAKRKVRLKINKIDEIKGPAIVLCTHGSFMDFLYVCLTITKGKPSAMHARLYTYRNDLAWLLRTLGAFPKSMFAVDIENAKNSKRVLSDGRVLIMMPEARLSTVGEFEDIQDTTHRFFKKMNVPLYVIKINGNYFANPKWGDTWRKKAPVEVNLKQLVSQEEISSISEEELRIKINNAMYYNEFEWLENRPEIHYNHKTLAKGLENILYICPKCKKRLTINTYNNHLYCSECGLKATLNDRYGFENALPFKNFAEWYNFQKDVLKTEIESDKDYSLTANVELKLPSLDGKTFMRKAGFGTCTLNRSGLTYKGTCDGENIEKVFPMQSLYRLLFGAGEDFEIYENKTLWWFEPENKKSCVIWYNASEILKNLSVKESQGV